MSELSKPSSGASTPDVLSPRIIDGAVDMTSIPETDASIGAQREKVFETPQEQGFFHRELNPLAALFRNTFAITSNEEDMKKSINLDNEALKAIDKKDPFYYKILYETGRKWRSLYNHTANILHLRNAITATAEVVDSAPNGLSEPKHLIELSDWHWKIFGEEERTEDLNASISRGEQALSAIGQHTGTQQFGPRLEYNLCSKIWARYKQLKAKFDLERAKVDLERIINLLETTIGGGGYSAKPDTSDSFYRLSRALRERYVRGYQKNRAADDLKRAIGLSKACIEACHPTHAELPKRLAFLGNMLRELYERSGDDRDIDEALVYTDKGFKASAPSPDQATVLDALALQYLSRYKQRASSEDLEHAIKNAKAAVELNHRNLKRHKCNLCVILVEKYKGEGSSDSDADFALKIANQVLEEASEGSDHGPNEARARALMTLASLKFGIYMKHRDTGRIDLEESLKLAEQAYSFAPEGSSNLRATIRNDLSMYFMARFRLTGDPEDLQGAMNASLESEKLMEAGQLDRAPVLFGLATMYEHRSRRTRSLEDLRFAIRYFKEASEIVTPHHATKSVYLNCWAACLGYLYDRTNVLQDLKDSVSIARGALKSALQYNPIKHASCLLTLSRRLGALYRVEERKEYLTQAIATATEAHDIVVAHKKNQSATLSNLCCRYAQLNDLSYMHIAIDYAKQALQACEKTSLHRGTVLHRLGKRFQERAMSLCHQTDFDQAIYYFEEAFRTTNSPPHFRLRSAQQACDLLVLGSMWKPLSILATEAVELLPLVSPSSLAREDQQDVLKMMSGFASRAAAALLQDGGKPSRALKILELGRGIINGHRYELRIDLTALQKANNNLAKKFEQLREELDSSPEESTMVTRTMLDPLSPSARRELALKKMEKLLATIRGLGGPLKRFLSPLRTKQMKDAADSGTIIVINVSYRCDAIFVSKGSKVTSLPLPALSLDDIKDRASANNTLTSEAVITAQLKWLWTSVAKPVLESIKYHVDSDGPTSDLPRVWWVLTGPMCCFPIHAAGIDGSTTLNRVVSSYIPSIKALIYTRGNKNRLPAPNKTILAWMGPLDSKGKKDPKGLLYAEKEVEAIRALFPESMDNLVNLERPSLNTIKYWLEDKPDSPSCNIFHFCGHGNADEKDPSKSYLKLEDGVHLTVNDLLNVRLYENPPTLAYLSACWTARTSMVWDEAIHLTGAFQLSGFRHVIGSLWTLPDNAAVTVAEGVYQRVFKGQADNQDIGFCLHDTVRQLMRDKRNKLTARTWAALIHVGI